MYNESILLTRSEMLAEFGIADATERKQRGGQDWIPHLEIGARVYYRRAAVEQWIRERELTSTTGIADV